MLRFIIYIILLALACIPVQAQELNARLTINTQKLQSADKQLFSSLESNLNQMLNEQKWTDATFSRQERIDCTIAITLSDTKVDDNTYAADIQITARRPVYNSTYITPTLNFRDTEFSFDYEQGQTLNFNSMYVDNNLVAVVSYYAYLIIGIDFDSFSLNGGKPYFAKAMEIANMAQSLNTNGWEPFSGKNSNRYDLAMALTEESSSSFHTMWYNYHRLGLDEMAANASRGRIRIIEAINNDLQKLYEARSSSPLITVMAETKVDEIVRVCSKATDEEKKDLKTLLSKIFPTKSSLIKGL